MSLVFQIIRNRLSQGRIVLHSTFWLKPFWLKIVLFLVLSHPRKTARHAPWSAFPTPAGWNNVIRGHRPPTEQWPRRQEQWREWNYGQRPALFPEAKRSQVQRRWQRNIPRRNPDEVQVAGRAKITRLEEALKVLGEDDSTEVRGLQAALQEARRAVQDRPMAQIEQCQAFIERSRSGWKRNRRKSGREEMARTVPPTTPPRVRDHTARKDPRSRGRARSFEGTGERDGDRDEHRRTLRFHPPTTQCHRVSICRCSHCPCAGGESELEWSAA